MNQSVTESWESLSFRKLMHEEKHAEFYRGIDEMLKREHPGEHMTASGFDPAGAPFIRCTDGCEKIREVDTKLKRDHWEKSR
jgi:hypothetical protein